MKASTYEWDDELVKKYIENCVINEKGTPFFMRYLWGAPLPKNTVMLVCKHQIHRRLSPMLLINIPEIIRKILKEYPKNSLDEWKAVYAAIAHREDIIKLREKAPYSISDEDVDKMLLLKHKLDKQLL